ARGPPGQPDLRRLLGRRGPVWLADPAPACPSGGAQAVPRPLPARTAGAIQRQVRAHLAEALSRLRRDPGAAACRGAGAAGGGLHPPAPGQAYAGPLAAERSAPLKRPPSSNPVTKSPRATQ